MQNISVGSSCCKAYIKHQINTQNNSTQSSKTTNTMDVGEWKDGQFGFKYLHNSHLPYTFIIQYQFKLLILCYDYVDKGSVDVRFKMLSPNTYTT